jgi:hypothetical protein
MSAVKQFEFAANIMNVKMRKLLLIGFFAITLVLPLAADIKADWQVEWDQTVRDAQAEGKLSIYHYQGDSELGAVVSRTRRTPDYLHYLDRLYRSRLLTDPLKPEGIFIHRHVERKSVSVSHNRETAPYYSPLDRPILVLKASVRPR